jgi:hypothetical protein
VDNTVINKKSQDNITLISNVFKHDITDKEIDSKFNGFIKWTKAQLKAEYTYLNEEEIDRVFNCIFSMEKANYYYDDEIGTFSLVQTEKQLKTIITTKFKLLDIRTIFNEIADDDTRNNTIKNLNKFLINDFLNMLLITNSYTHLKVSINPFSDKEKVKRNAEVLELCKNKIYFNIYESMSENLDDVIKYEYIKDFTEHFEKLMEILDWIIDCRFAKNRRKSYLYLRMNAGFGKTFFMSLLKEIGISISVKYTELNKDPSGLSPVVFLNTICMFIDEFKTFGADLKDLTNKITVTSKMKLRAEVDIYSKIFISVEKSSSFFGGVDPQIKDRMNMIDLESMKLENRPKYKENPTLYFAVVKEFCWKYLRMRLDNYLKLTELKATEIADKRLLDFYEKNGLQSENLENRNGKTKS